jgi:transposase
MTDVHWPWPPPKTETTFSDSGPECPNYHSIMHTDEPFFFDESGFEIECTDCGASHDRDVNAARNILNAALSAQCLVEGSRCYG